MSISPSSLSLTTLPNSPLSTTSNGFFSPPPSPPLLRRPPPPSLPGDFPLLSPLPVAPPIHHPLCSHSSHTTSSTHSSEHPRRRWSNCWERRSTSYKWKESSQSWCYLWRSFCWAWDFSQFCSFCYRSHSGPIAILMMFILILGFTFYVKGPIDLFYESWWLKMVSEFGIF